MSFLSTAFLAALPLVAAPILLHLFDRRRRVVIPWGAMQFLQEAATRKSSARRIQHHLLLLLRVLTVAALVLALSRPLVPGSWFGAIEPRDTILVIDNSLSTQQRSDTGSVFEALRTRAEETVRGLAPGSSLRILVAAPYPTWVTPARVRVGPRTRGELIEQVRALRPTEGRGDLPSALLKGVQSHPEDDQLAGRRVILVTDGQRHDWRIEDAAGWARFTEAVASLPLPTTLELVEIPGRPDVANIAVTRLRSHRTVVGVRQPLSVAAEIRNFGAGATKTVPATWHVDDRHHASDAVAGLLPGETRDSVQSFSFAQPGVYTITCHIESGDDLPPDDSASLVVEVVERIPVLVVEGSEGFAEMQQDAYLVRAALGQVEGDDSTGWRAVFDPRTVSPQQLESIDLRDFQAVVVPNLTELSESAVARLTPFVASGGGVWLALGPRTDMDAFHRHLYRSGDGLSPTGLSRIIDESPDKLLWPTINPFLKRHPATAHLADDERLDIGDIKVGRRFRLHMPSEAEVTVLLDLSNGEPLAVERQFGSGRVIVLAVPLRFQWSELAASQAFAVMVHEWLGYLTEPRATRHNLSPGDPIVFHSPGMETTHATLTTPEGNDIAIAGEPSAGGVAFRTSRTAIPGRYALEIGLAGSTVPFHVGREAGESDLTPLTPADRAFLTASAKLDGTPLVSPGSGPSLRTPLWPALLLLLIALIASELLLSGAVARRRFGSPSIAGGATGPLASPAPLPVHMSWGYRSQGARPTDVAPREESHV